MGIGSIGSISFWQQDQNNWNQEQAQAQSAQLNDSLISAMGSLMTNEAKGMASIATQQAQDRVHAQLVAALQSAVQASQAGSSGSTSNSSTTGAAATGTGTVPLSANTALLTLGIPKNGIITVSDGTNQTTFASTGTDTVGDLINAINSPNHPTNAQVTASLNASGKLVLTGNNKTVSISVGGTFASNVGFGAKNSTFQPTAPASSTANSSSSSSSSTPSTSSNSSSTATSGASSSTGSSTTTPASPPAAVPFNSAYALQTGGTAETLLATTGQVGSLLNRFA